MYSCKNGYGYGRVTILAFLLNIFSLVPAHAQVAGGSVTGTIMDSSGSAIPKAQLSIKNRSTDVTRAVDANDDGFYAAPNLLPGQYQVTASATGFEPKGVNVTL